MNNLKTEELLSKSQLLRLLKKRKQLMEMKFDKESFGKQLLLFYTK